MLHWRAALLLVVCLWQAAVGPLHLQMLERMKRIVAEAPPMGLLWEGEKSGLSPGHAPAGLSAEVPLL